MSTYGYSCMAIASNRLIIKTKSSSHPTHFLIICSGALSASGIQGTFVILHVHFKEWWLPEFQTVTQTLKFSESKEKKEKHMSCPTFVGSFFSLSLALTAALSVEQESECLHVETFSEI